MILCQVVSLGVPLVIPHHEGPVIKLHLHGVPEVKHRDVVLLPLRQKDFDVLTPVGLSCVDRLRREYRRR